MSKDWMEPPPSMQVMAIGGRHAPRPAYVPALKQGQEERKFMELFSKWTKAEADRLFADKMARERLIRQGRAREQRFERLLDNMLGHNTLVGQTAAYLQELGAIEDQRCRRLHAEWEASIYGPLAAQVHSHLNPPNRAAHQKSMGSKSVIFRLPGQTFQPVVASSKDPLRKDLVEQAKETAFHEAANGVLMGSRSAPDLLQRCQRDGGVPLPPALTKDTLHPTRWNPVPLAGYTNHDFDDKVARPVFMPEKRMGHGVFEPDESDGVRMAGTKKTPGGVLHDKGILRGSFATRGEAGEMKTDWGCGSIAPGQDHFTFPHSREAVDAEFPTGKRTFYAEMGMM